MDVYQDEREHFELYAKDLLTLTREQFNNFRQKDMIMMTSGPTSPPPGPTTSMTTFTGHTKGTTASESSRRVQKGMYEPVPSSRRISTMMLSRDLSLHYQSTRTL